MDHVRWLAEPPLERPILLSAFTGWNDAGDAASTAIRSLIEAWGATPLGIVDPEIFTDFATVRPNVSLRTDERGRKHRDILWPNVELWSARLPSADVILVVGPEPALRWRLFTDQFVGLCQRFNVRLAISLGALLADVAHSRPVQLIGTSSDPELVERHQLEESRYQGPTGIVGVLASVLAEAGVPTLSLWAAVPGYAAQFPSPKAALRLVNRACSVLQLPAPLTPLTGGANEYDTRIDDLVAADEDLSAYVRRLVAMSDDDDLGTSITDGPPSEPTLLPPPPHDLMDELERFLRNLDDRDDE